MPQAKMNNMPFQTLAVRYEGGDVSTSVFSVGDTPGAWIDPYICSISWHALVVYGIPDAQDDEISDLADEDDFSAATRMGKITGCLIPRSLIVNLGADPYEACDAENGDLEAMYSVFQEYEDHEDFQDLIDNIFYIQEIELDPAYQGLGYETIILLQIPGILVNALHVFPDLLMYCPTPTHHDEPERDPKAEAILLHRLEYNTQAALGDKADDNITLFPPLLPVPETEINRVMGKRNPGETVPIAYRDRKLYKQYKDAGFKEAGKTGWLYKCIHSIYTKDGLNR